MEIDTRLARCLPVLRERRIVETKEYLVNDLGYWLAGRIFPLRRKLSRYDDVLVFSYDKQANKGS